MVLDELKPAGWGAIHDLNRGQIDTLLKDLEARTHGTLSSTQRAGISVVTGLMASNRAQYFEIGGEGPRGLVLGGFDAQTRDRLSELPEDTKQKIRDVAALLGTVTLRNDPTAPRGEVRTINL